jgi:hypothetical protein
MVITRGVPATGAAQQQPEADPQLESLAERQLRGASRRGGVAGGVQERV